MKKLNKFAMYALILPVGTFAAGAAFADNEQDGSVMQPSHSGAPGHGMPKSDRDRMGAERDGEADVRMGMSAGAKRANYMTTTPDRAVRIDKVVGSTLHLRSDNEEVGTIDDLIIDESGQVVAVVVAVGGILGMGQHPVAISWDSIERTTNEDRDGYLFSVDATEDALRDAPAYDKDSTGIRDSNY